MQFAGFFFAVAAVVVFVLMPAIIIATRWRRWEPEMRRGMLIIAAILLAGCGLVGLLIYRWSNGPLT